jgi:hypothetical protein
MTRSNSQTLTKKRNIETNEQMENNKKIKDEKKSLNLKKRIWEQQTFNSWNYEVAMEGISSGEVDFAHLT